MLWAILFIASMFDVSSKFMTEWSRNELNCMWHMKVDLCLWKQIHWVNGIISIYKVKLVYTRTLDNYVSQPYFHFILHHTLVWTEEHMVLLFFCLLFQKKKSLCQSDPYITSMCCVQRSFICCIYVHWMILSLGSKVVPAFFGPYSAPHPRYRHLHFCT